MKAILRAEKMNNVDLQAIKKARLTEQDKAIFDLLGLSFDPWQIWLIYRMVNDKMCDVSAPRQNGKTHAVIGAVLLFMLSGLRVLYCTHNLDLATEVGGMVCNYASSDTFKSLLKRTPLSSKQYTQIDLVNGGRFFARTRSSSSGAGFTFDVVIYDEAQYLTNAQFDSIQFTQFTSRDVHTVMLGTPLLDHELEDAPNRPFYQAWESGSVIEWSVGKYDAKINVASKMLLKQSNPGLSRANMDSIDTEREKLTHVAFCQQRFGCWLKYGDDEVVGEPVLTDKQVARLLTKTPATDGRYDLAIAVDDYADQAVFSVCQNGRLEVVKVFESSELQMMATWIAERNRKISKVYIKKSVRAEAIRELLATRKALYKKISLLSAPFLSERYRQFIQACKVGSIRVFEDSDVRSALKTFWQMETKQEYTLLRGGRPLFEMIVQSLALHIGVYRERKNDDKKPSDKPKRKVAVF
jgi:hypothetical protein